MKMDHKRTIHDDSQNQVSRRRVTSSKQLIAWKPLERREDATFVHADRCRGFLRVDVRSFRGRAVLRQIRALDESAPVVGAALVRQKLVQRLIALERAAEVQRGSASGGGGGVYERVQELDDLDRCVQEQQQQKKDEQQEHVAPESSGGCSCDIEGVSVLGGVLDLLHDDDGDVGASELTTEQQRLAQDGVDSTTYFYLPHTADVCPVALGDSVGDALKNYVIALCNYMTDTRHECMGIPDTFERAVERAQSGDRSLRVVRFRIVARDFCPRRALQNLIYKTLDTYLNVFQQYKLVFRHGRVLQDVTQTADGLEVELEFVGARFSRVRHVVGTEVKAITLHMLLLQRNDDVLLRSVDVDGDAGEAGDAGAGEMIRSFTGADASDAALALRATMQQYRDWYSAASAAAAGSDVFRLQLVVDI